MYIIACGAQDVLEGLSDFSLPELDSVAMRVKKELPLTPEQVYVASGLAYLIYSTCTNNSF